MNMMSMYALVSVYCDWTATEDYVWAATEGLASPARGNELLAVDADLKGAPPV